MIETLLSFMAYVGGIISFGILGILVLVVSVLYPPLYFPACKKACQIILFCAGAKVDMPHPFPKVGGPFILMFNHTSFIEVFLLPAIIEGNFSAVTKEENGRVPLFGLIIKQLRVVFIDRSSKRKAIESVNSAKEKIDSGYHLIYSPEGTRSLSGQLYPLKKGGFHLAIGCKAPILVIGFEGAYQYKPKNRWRIRPGVIKVRYSDPIPTEGYSSDNLAELKDLVESELKRLSGQSSDLAISL
ncbi:MAG: lysophospholipid acyltransferase family protein [Bacteroidota bacterium]